MGGRSGREWDSETGLYYLHARYQDPKVGRFISEDPIGFQGSFNFYAYVANNPATWTDPLGLYNCYYYIANHTLVCEPDNPTNSWFISNNIISGRNGPELINPAQQKSYSECSDCPNNPQRTNRSGRGPAPEGTYSIGPMGGGNHPTWRPLTPTTPTGRTGIYTHYCSNPATCSEGCISLTNMQDFNQFNQLLNVEPQNTMDITSGANAHRCRSCR
jgi:RHS repeat-associated protein